MNLPAQSLDRANSQHIDLIVKQNLGPFLRHVEHLKQRKEVIMNYSTLKAVLLFYVDVRGGAECQAS